MNYLAIHIKPLLVIYTMMIQTRSARMGETSTNEIKSIKRYSILISIEHSWMNQVDWHSEDSEYLNTINIQYWKLLFNVTERGWSKFPPRILLISFNAGRSMDDFVRTLYYTSHCQTAWFIVTSSTECQFSKHQIV